MSASLDGWACTGCTYLNEDDAGTSDSLRTIQLMMMMLFFF